jgi:uncharacterized protein with PQ loop repeat
MKELSRAHCEEGWPQWTCDVGVVCEYITLSGIFVAFLPQIYKNYQRQSTDGVSFLWALCAATGNLLSVFFIFNQYQSLLCKICSVYLLLIDAIFVWQFIFYSKNSKYHFEQSHHRAKLVVFIVCWIVFLIVDEVITSDEYDSVQKSHDMYVLEWFAITFYSVSLLPQLYINFRECSADGQAFSSVMLQLLLRLTEFASSLLLKAPKQSLILGYFVASSATFNAVQNYYYNECARITAKYGTSSLSQSSLKMLVVWRICVSLISCGFLILTVGFVIRMHLDPSSFTCPIILVIIVYTLYAVALARRAKLSAILALQKYFPHNENYTKLLFNPSYEEVPSVDKH